MRISENQLRKEIRKALFEIKSEEDFSEHFRHESKPHKHTPSSHRVIRSMQKSADVQQAFDTVKNPRDLAAIIEELIDGAGLSRDEIKKALSMIMQHERPRGSI